MADGDKANSCEIVNLGLEAAIISKFKPSHLGPGNCCVALAPVFSLANYGRGEFTVSSTILGNWMMIAYHAENPDD